MKRKKVILLSLVAVVIALAVAIPLAGGSGGNLISANPSSGVPERISYQGRLTDSNGNSLTDGNYQIAFRLYKVLTEGEPIWSETQTVPLSKGLFNVLLGSVNSLSPEYFEGASYLEVVVGDEVMTPRQQLVSVPYAFRADNADMVDGQHASAFATKSELSTPGSINNAGNPVDWTKLKNVPAGFADGADDVSTSGGGSSSDGGGAAFSLTFYQVNSEWIAPFFLDAGVACYTFIAIYNASDVAQTVQVSFYDKNGVFVGNAGYVIAAGATCTTGTESAPGGVSGTSGNEGSLHITTTGTISQLLPWGAILFP